MAARPAVQLSLAIAAAVGTLFGVQGISAAAPVAGSVPAWSR
jgi:hypothetical protein